MNINPFKRGPGRPKKVDSESAANLAEDIQKQVGTKVYAQPEAYASSEAAALGERPQPASLPATPLEPSQEEAQARAKERVDYFIRNFAVFGPQDVPGVLDAEIIKLDLLFGIMNEIRRLREEVQRLGET